MKSDKSKDVTHVDLATRQSTTIRFQLWWTSFIRTHLPYFSALQFECHLTPIGAGLHGVAGVLQIRSRTAHNHSMTADMDITSSLYVYVLRTAVSLLEFSTSSPAGQVISRYADHTENHTKCQMIGHASTDLQTIPHARLNSNNLAVVNGNGDRRLI